VAELDEENMAEVSRPIPPELLPPPIDVKENTITADDLADMVRNHQSIWGPKHLMRSEDDGETYRCGADGCRTAVRVVGDPGIEEW